MPRDALGLSNDTVQLMDYQTAWMEVFKEERKRLEKALGSAVLDVQHIGSTAVPGLSAKPILYIGVAVEDFGGAFALIADVEALGYLHRGERGVSRRHLFVKGPPERRTHHVHMLEHSSQEWRNLIFFRDYLRAHPKAVTRYQTLKTQLAKQFSKDREAYTGGKHAFVQNILGRAD